MLPVSDGSDVMLPGSQTIESIVAIAVCNGTFTPIVAGSGGLHLDASKRHTIVSSNPTFDMIQNGQVEIHGFALVGYHIDAGGLRKATMISITIYTLKILREMSFLCYFHFDGSGVVDVNFIFTRTIKRIAVNQLVLMINMYVFSAVPCRLGFSDGALNLEFSVQ